MIEVGLQRRRHAEVVERQAEHHDVGGLQFVDQFFAGRRMRLLFGRALFDGRKERLHAFGAQVRQRIAGEIADDDAAVRIGFLPAGHELVGERSEEHTSELQSLMRISYAVFCLKKKKDNYESNTTSP